MSRNTKEVYTQIHVVTETEGYSSVVDRFNKVLKTLQTEHELDFVIYALSEGCAIEFTGSRSEHKLVKGVIRSCVREEQ